MVASSKGTVKAMLAPALAVGAAMLAVAVVLLAIAGASARADSRGKIHFSGEARRGRVFEKALPNGMRFVLQPSGDEGWRIGIYASDSTQNLVAIATPPYHGVNASVIEAWHFRNQDNSGPNTGDVNAPQRERGFYFLEDPGDFPAYADALDRLLHASTNPDSDQGILDRAPVGEGTLTIRGMKLGGLGPGDIPHFDWLRFEVRLMPQAAPSRKEP